MIIPMCCFTCGKPISHLWNKYQKILQEEKVKSSFKELNEFTIENMEKTPEYKALISLGIKRYCCKRMFLGNVDMCEDI